MAADLNQPEMLDMVAAHPAEDGSQDVASDVFRAVFLVTRLFHAASRSGCSASTVSKSKRVGMLTSRSIALQ